MPVLDTDALTILQRQSEPGHSRMLARMRALPPGTVVFVTVVSFDEQLRGWLEYVKRAKPEELPKRYSKLRELTREFGTRPMLDFDEAAAGVYARLLRARPNVATMDLRIAAIAIAREELLVSANLRHFSKVPGLRVEDWTRP